MTSQLTRGFAQVSRLRDAIILDRQKPELEYLLFTPRRLLNTVFLEQAGHFSLSQRYLNAQENILQSMSQSLYVMPDLRWTMANFDRMDREAQQKFGERYLAMLASAQSDSGVPVQPATLHWSDDHRLSAFSEAFSLQDAAGENDKIFINRAPVHGNADRLSVFLSSLTMAQNAVYQASTARAVMNDWIKLDHPHYQDGLVIAALYRNGADIGPSLRNAWNRQAHQKDTRTMGIAIRGLLSPLELTEEKRAFRTLKTYEPDTPAP